MLEAMEKEGLLKRQQQGRQWYVVSISDSTIEPKGGDGEMDHDHAESHEHSEPEEESIPDPEDDDLAL